MKRLDLAKLVVQRTVLVVPGLAAVLAVSAAHSAPRPQEAVAPPSHLGVPSMQTGLLFRTVQVEGKSLNYAVYLPRNYDASKSWPVILFLHGYGESGTDGVRQCAVGLMPAVLNDPNAWPFIIVAPQKPDLNPLWDVYAAEVFAALDQTMREYNADADRVYLTGLSQGGFGTWTLGSMQPERFAALAPVCGFGDAETIGPRVKSLPIWAFHGLKDTVVVPEKSRSLVAAVKAAQAADAGGTYPAPKLTEFPDADHNSWDAAYRNSDLGGWFLAHTRPGK